MAVERYEIIIAQRGAQQTARSIEDIGRSAQRTTSLLKFLRDALVVYASIRIFDVFFKFADSLTLVQNRIGLVTNGAAEARVVFDELVQVALRSRFAFADTVDIYSRLARSTKDLGLSQRQTIDLTEALTKTIAISGTTTQEGKNALIQFGQALASNRLGGDELRSVMENLPVLVEHLRKGLVGLIPGFRGTLGEFRELSKQGKLTGDILIQALQKQLPEINAQFAKTVPTIAQAFNNLSTQAFVFFTRLNEGAGITGTLARSIQYLADNFDKVATAGAAALGAILIPLLVRTVAAMSPVVRIIGGLVAAFEFFPDTVRAVASEFSAFATNTDGSRNAFGRFIDAVTEGGPKMQAFLASAQRGAIIVTAAWEVATEKFGLVWRAAGEVFIDVVNAIIRGFSRFLTFFTDGFDFLVRKAAGLQRAIGNEGLAKSIEDTLLIKGVDLGQVENVYRGAGEKLGEAFGDAVRRKAAEVFARGGAIGENAEIFAKLATPQQQLDAFRRADAASVAELDRLRARQGLSTPGARNVVPGRDKGAERTENVIRSISAELQKQINLLGIIDPKERAIAQAREQAVATLVSRAKLSRAQAEALTAEGTALGNLLRQHEELLALSKARTASFEAARGPARDYELALRGITENLKAGIISQQEFNAQVRDARIAFLDTQKTLGAGFERFFLKMQRDVEDVASAVESVLTKAFDAAADAVVEFAQTGRLSIGNFLRDIQADLLRMATKSVLASIAGQLGIGQAPQTSFLGSLFGGALGRPQGEFGAGASGGSAGGGFLDSIFGGIGKLFGFQNGGDFTIGPQTALAGLSGADDRLVMFRGRTGENVSVRPAGEDHGSSAPVINFTVYANDAASFGKSRGQILTDLHTVAARAAKRNG